MPFSEVPSCSCSGQSGTLMVFGAYPMSEFEVPFSCQGGNKVIMKFIGSVFMCHPSYKTFQFLGNNWREVVHLPFPFVFSSWAFGVKFFWIIVRTVIEVINGVVLVVLHPLTQLIKSIWPSQLQDCLEDVLKLLLEFLLGFKEEILLGFTHWCFRMLVGCLMLKL